MRKSWEEYFIDQAFNVAIGRSTCIRRKVGAIIVLNKRIVSTGYNGAPEGVKHCEEEGLFGEPGCIRDQMGIPSGERQECCKASHAEQNAIVQAARYGPNIDGADLYSTLFPCCICARMIINAGIKRVFYAGSYNDKISLRLLTEAGIEIIHLRS